VPGSVQIWEAPKGWLGVLNDDNACDLDSVRCGRRGGEGKEKNNEPLYAALKR